MTFADLWRRGQAGWPRSSPLVQAPNPPLLVALAGRRLAAAAGPTGRLHRAGRLIFKVALGVWAWEELTAGANGFRRALGAAALAWVAAGRERGSRPS